MQRSDLLTAIDAADLSPKTKSNYVWQVSAFEKHSGKPIETIITNPDTYIPLIRKWYPKETTRKVNTSTILGLFRYNTAFKTEHMNEYNKWVESFKEARDKVDARYEENKPSKRQELGYVPYDKIIAMRDKKTEGSIERLLLGMYTHLRPMRCEYARVAIYKGVVPADNVEPNYIIMKANGARMIIKHFKTRKYHESYNILLPRLLYNDLVKSLDIQPRKWLFENTKNEPYSHATFTAWTMNVFKTMFKRPLSVSIIRHSYINTIDFNKLSIKEKREIATAMGHTIETQDRYRLLFSADDSCNSECNQDKTTSTI